MVLGTMRATTSRTARGPVPVHARKTVALQGASLRIVAVADTHGRPHPSLGARLAELSPGHILHAGDVGDRGVLHMLEEHAPVTAVRGNIDGRELPDVFTLEVRDAAALLITVLLTHIAVSGPRLRADVARLALAEGASLVVCGHSHVPFAAHDRGLTVFNPGSVGPRRFSLPIVLGLIDIGPTGASVRHIDCETGFPWSP
jgi:putative phosphoesterase